MDCLVMDESTVGEESEVPMEEVVQSCTRKHIGSIFRVQLTCLYIYAIFHSRIGDWACSLVLLRLVWSAAVIGPGCVPCGAVLEAGRSQSACEHRTAGNGPTFGAPFRKWDSEGGHVESGHAPIVGGSNLRRNMCVHTAIDSPMHEVVVWSTCMEA